MLVTWPHVKMSLGRRPNCSWWPDGQACRMARSYPWMWMSEGESSRKAIWIIYKLVFMQKRLKVLDVRLNHPASETPSYSLTPCGRIKTPDWWQKTSLQLTEPKQAENTGWSNEVHSPDETAGLGMLCLTGSVQGSFEMIAWTLVSFILRSLRGGILRRADLRSEGARSVWRISVVAERLQHTKFVSVIWMASSASLGGSFVFVWNTNGELGLNIRGSKLILWAWIG